MAYMEGAFDSVTSTTAPRYLSGGGNTDPLPENVGKGPFEGSTGAIVVEGKEEER